MCMIHSTSLPEPKLDALTYATGSDDIVIISLPFRLLKHGSREGVTHDLSTICISRNCYSPAMIGHFRAAADEDENNNNRDQSISCDIIYSIADYYVCDSIGLLPTLYCLLCPNIPSQPKHRKICSIKPLLLLLVTSTLPLLPLLPLFAIQTQEQRQGTRGFSCSPIYL